MKLRVCLCSCAHDWVVRENICEGESLCIESSLANRAASMHCGGFHSSLNLSEVVVSGPVGMVFWDSAGNTMAGLRNSHGTGYMREKQRYRGNRERDYGDKT